MARSYRSLFALLLILFIALIPVLSGCDDYLEERFKKAQEGFSKVEIQKLSAEAWDLYESKEYEEALSKVEAALILDPNNTSNKGLRKLIEKAIEEKKTPDPKKQAESLAGEAYTLYESGKYEEALSKTKEAINLDGSNWQYKLLRKQIEAALLPKTEPEVKMDPKLEPEVAKKAPPPTPKLITSTSNRSTKSEGSYAGEKKTITIKGIDYTFAWCPPGSFEMGEYRFEKHNVRISKGFWMLEHEVTQEMYESLMGKNPSDFKGANLPVEYVTWNDAKEFCEKLSGLSGYKCYLPTEAQWEYACRAGTIEEYGGSGDLDEMGWYRDNSGKRTHEVKTKKANEWGLYDMHGNVFEWCSDWYDKDYYKNSPTTDPQGPESDSGRVFRGGSWYDDAGSCRSFYRFCIDPEFWIRYLGFRFALSLSEE
ncbi:MAG: SUMF1/EgtB/PvdO family nonheme iron enzyme [Planctomycetia bacterium]|nr:SUMF1/EgtB/PvdO family nonheme iron enzyme [Planctomycetia bacterium]